MKNAGEFGAIYIRNFPMCVLIIKLEFLKKCNNFLRAFLLVVNDINM